MRDGDELYVPAKPQIGGEDHQVSTAVMGLVGGGLFANR